jgi:hypothetical protein
MSTLVAKAETLAVDVSYSRDALCVALSDGRVVSVPLVGFRGWLAPQTMNDPTVS